MFGLRPGPIDSIPFNEQESKKLKIKKISDMDLFS